MEIRHAVTSLGALAQETRLAIFRLLVQAGPEGLSAGKIGETLGVAPATLSFHLRELRHAGLTDSRRDSKQIIYSANYETMNDLLSYLTENCCRDALSPKLGGERFKTGSAASNQACKVD